MTSSRSPAGMDAPARHWPPAALGALGVLSVLAGAPGVALLALWVLDGSGPASDLPELIGGAILLALAAVSAALRHRLLARQSDENATDPSHPSPTG